MGQSNAEKKYRNHYCFTANHRIYGGMLGIGIGNSCLVGISALARLDVAATARSIVGGWIARMPYDF